MDVSTWRAGARTRGPLRGREREYERVLAVLDAPPTTPGRVVVITGARGIGKTHLLGEVRRAAGQRDFQVNVPREGAGLDRPVDLAEPVRRPTLVTVDDAHRADPARLAEFVGSTRKTGAVLAMAGAAGHDGVDWFPSHASADVTTIELPPLGDDAVRDVVADHVMAVPSAALVEFAEQAGGNPNLLGELLTGLAEERRLCMGGGQALLRAGGVPARAKAMVRAELGRLSPCCRQMLQVASVLGRALHPEALAVALGETVAALLPLVEEAAASGIVATRDGALVFQSTLVWRVVRGTIPEPVLPVLEKEVRQVRLSLAELAEPVEDAAFDPPGTPDDEDSLPADGPGGSTRGDGTDGTDDTGDTGDVVEAGRRARWNRLTDHERTIAGLVSSGFTNQQIAKRVYLSPHTVNYHLRRIFRKLDIGSRAELAGLARSVVPHQLMPTGQSD
jgi:DNA-binding CsgD family transcriptional regulator